MRHFLLQNALFASIAASTLAGAASADIGFPAAVDLCRAQVPTAVLFGVELRERDSVLVYEGEMYGSPIANLFAPRFVAADGAFAGLDDDTADETSDGGLDQEKASSGSPPSTSSHDVSLDAAERGGAGSDVPSSTQARKPKLKPSSSVGELDVPAAVPEMSELMEIQMMARSQAIGGTKGAWSETKNGARDESGKTRRSRARSGC